MAKESEQINKEIQDFGQIRMDRNPQQHNIQLLSIIGEVEGHECLASTAKTTKYEHVLPKLAALEDDSETDGLWCCSIRWAVMWSPGLPLPK